MLINLFFKNDVSKLSSIGGDIMKTSSFVKRLSQRQWVFPPVISTIEEHPKFWVVRLQGPIDTATVAELEAFGEKWERQDGFIRKHILLDFQKVTRTDSAAVAILIEATAILRKEHHAVGAINIDETLRFMFGLFKVSNIICLFHDEAEAVKKFNEQ